MPVYAIITHISMRLKYICLMELDTLKALNIHKAKI